MKAKRMITGLLVTALMMSTVGCMGQGKTNGSEMTIWSEASTVKIKQFDDGEAVKNAGSKNVLKVNMAQNESEGVQLMIYAKKDIEAYEVTVSDLVSENGIIPADQIDIYHVFYQTAEGNGKAGNPLYATGETPDPMLPFEKAVEYQENFIQKGANQMVFLDVETKASTPAGLYTGVATVTVEGDKFQMPMEVTVYDVVYPDNRGLKTAFSYFDRDHFATAELDASDEQTTAYFETLLEYNMSSWLPFEGTGGITKYLELLKQYYNEPGFSAYRLYYQTAGGTYNGKPVRYNAALLKEYIIAIAKMSVEDRVNYLDKAYTYFYTVADEPATEEQFLTAKAALDTFNEVLRDADTQLRELYGGTSDYEYYANLVSETLLDIESVLPGSYDVGDARKYGLDNLTFVPEISNLHSESDRYYYTYGREDSEIWAYSCVGPIYPYPTGHTDDYSLGFRLTSWMCHGYDWDGYLMWGVTSYLDREYGDVIADAWETMNTGHGRPGDGKLFYPGEKYGLDTPCPSLRAIAYRDGVDDYALLNTVTAIYEEEGLDAQAALQPLYDSLYSGVIPITDSDLFETIREGLFQMIDELRSGVGVLYKDAKTELATATFSFKTVDAQAKVEAQGTELAKDEEGCYHVEVDLTKQSEYTFTVTSGEQTKEYTRILLDGTLGHVNGFEEIDDMGNYVFSSAAGYAAEVNTDENYVKDGSQSLHLVMNPEKTETIPYFAIEKGSKLIGGSWEDIKMLKFYLYNPSKEEVSMDATYYTSKEVSVGTYTLAAEGWTLVEIPMPQDIKDVEAIQEFDFNFAEGSSVEVYLDSFVTVVKGD